MASMQIDQLRRDGGTQPRAALIEQVISEYADAMQGGEEFPAVIVFYDGTDYWLADGFHRTDAALRSGRNHVEADIRQGTRRDAILFSVGANAEHGQRRTNADKRRGVETLLRDHEWGRWTDREIARRACVTHPFVARVRAELSGNRYQIAQASTPPALQPSEVPVATPTVPERPRKAVRNGTVYDIETARIGHGGQPSSSRAPTPSAAAEETPSNARATNEPAPSDAYELVLRLALALALPLQRRLCTRLQENVRAKEAKAAKAAAVAGQRQEESIDA